MTTSNSSVAARARESRALQRKGGAHAEDSHAAAERGVAGGGGSYPHQATIEKAFGAPLQAKAHTGAAATAACDALGAEAYASGDRVAFRDGAPSLHTAAHEAAHVVQQRSGAVQLKGGVGEVGDQYERHADAVADAVVQGKSAAPLLAQYGAGDGGAQAIQRQAVQLSGPDAQTQQTHREQDAYANAPDKKKALADMKTHNQRLGQLWLETDTLQGDLQKQYDEIEKPLESLLPWKNPEMAVATVKTIDNFCHALGSLYDKVTDIEKVVNVVKDRKAIFASAKAAVKSLDKNKVQTILTEMQGGKKFEEAAKHAGLPEDQIKELKKVFEAHKAAKDIGKAAGEIWQQVGVDYDHEATFDEAKQELFDLKSEIKPKDLLNPKKRLEQCVKPLLVAERFVAADKIQKIHASQGEIQQALAAIGENQKEAIKMHKAVNHAYWSLSQFLQKKIPGYKANPPVAAPKG